jgi:MFS family permease
VTFNDNDTGPAPNHPDSDLSSDPSPGASRRGLLSSPYLLLGLLTAGYLVAYIDRFLLGILVDPIKADLGVTDTQISFLQGLGFLLVLSVALIPMGWAADRFHRPRLIGGAMLVWTAATALSGLAPTFVLLLLWRGVVGVGEAAISPAGISLIGDRFPPRRLGLAIGIFSVGGSIGGGVSLAVGGAIYAWLSAGGGSDLPLLSGLAPWRGTFILAALPGIPIALAISLLPDFRKRVVAGSLRARTDTLSSRSALQAYLREAKVILPLLVLVTSFTNAAVIVSLYWTAPAFVRAYGWSIQEAGGVIGTIMIVTSAIGIFSAGVISDWLGSRTGGRRLMLAAFTAPISLIVAVLFGAVNSPTIGLVLVAILQLSNILTFGVSSIALQAITPGAVRGKITALLALTTNVVGAFAPTAVGALNDHVFTEKGGVIHSMTALFVITLTLASVLIWAAQKPYANLLSRRQFEAGALHDGFSADAA